MELSGFLYVCMYIYIYIYTYIHTYIQGLDPVMFKLGSMMAEHTVGLQAQLVEAKVRTYIHTCIYTYIHTYRGAASSAG